MVAVPLMTAVYPAVQAGFVASTGHPGRVAALAAALTACLLEMALGWCAFSLSPGSFARRDDTLPLTSPARTPSERSALLDYRFVLAAPSRLDSVGLTQPPTQWIAAAAAVLVDAAHVLARARVCRRVIAARGGGCAFAVESPVM